MATPHDPRANQKQRTRAAIVEAAAHLMRQGVEPTVAAAAEVAKVSRATAYRYFPTPEALQLEVAGVTPAYEPIEQLVRALDGEDAEARLLRFVEQINAVSFAEEARMRMALKVYLDTWFAGRGDTDQVPIVREGRRMRWLERILEPARRRTTKPQWRRLQAAVALTVGADAMVVMKDACRLGDEEAQDVLLWAAQTLLRAGLQDTEMDKPRRAKAPRQRKSKMD
jgi:AcrR family transcriptional regulator